jgi:glycogen debranching enzyme
VLPGLNAGRLSVASGFVGGRAVLLTCGIASTPGLIPHEVDAMAPTPRDWPKGRAMTNANDIQPYLNTLDVRPITRRSTT